MSYLNVIVNPRPYLAEKYLGASAARVNTSFVSALRHAVPQFAEFAIQDVTAFQEG
jgi:hypothetical protein